MSSAPHRISVDGLALHKIVFPLVWFGALAAFATGFLADPVANKNMLMVLVGMAVLGYVVVRHAVWDLVDEVYDADDHLLVRHNGQELRIDLTNIRNITFYRMRPPRMTLHLIIPGPLGAKVAFSPIKMRMINPFVKHPLLDDLEIRVRRARGQTGS